MRFDTLVAAALVAAIAIWVGYLYRAVQPGSSLVNARDEAWLIGLVLGGCAIDAIVAARVMRGRVGVGGLIWLGFRTLLSLVGFLFFTLPLYAFALIVLTRAPRRDPRTDPTRPHAYRSVADGWFGAATPLGWSRTLLGASQIGERQCVICRRAEDAPAPQHRHLRSPLGPESPCESSAMVGPRADSGLRPRSAPPCVDRARPGRPWPRRSAARARSRPRAGRRRPRPGRRSGSA